MVVSKLMDPDLPIPPDLANPLGIPRGNERVEVRPTILDEAMDCRNPANANGGANVNGQVRVRRGDLAQHFGGPANAGP